MKEGTIFLPSLICCSRTHEWRFQLDPIFFFNLFLLTTYCIRFRFRPAAINSSFSIPLISRPAQLRPVQPVRGLRRRHPRPVHTARGAEPGVARRLPQVLRVPDVPRRDVHVLRQGRQDLLQGGLPQVSRKSMFASFVEIKCLKSTE